MARDKQQNLFQPEDFPDLPTTWEAADLTDVVCAEVVLNLAVDQTFLYRIPDELRGRVQAGQRVKVPFGRGNQVQAAYCVGLAKPPETWGPERLAKIKFLAGLVDDLPLLSSTMLALTRWISENYLCPWGQVLESVIPAGVKNQAGTRMVTLLRLSEAARAQRASFPAQWDPKLGIHVT